MRRSRHDAAQLAAALEQRTGSRRRPGPGCSTAAGTGLSSSCSSRDRDVQAVAEVLEVVERQLLHLVRRVAAREVRAEAVALDRLREDDGRLAGVLRGRLVGRVDLAVVVAAALELPQISSSVQSSTILRCAGRGRRSARGRTRRRWP